MAGFKETPRQKMIGMMYLVLTAMLALNVSVEILDAFLVVNDSMEDTNKTLQHKSETAYARFEQQYQLNQNKVGPFWEKASKVRELTNDFISYVEDVKITCITRSEGISADSARVVDLRDLGTRDKYDETTNYLIGPIEGGKKGEAQILENKINAYREALMNYVNPAQREHFKVGLRTDGDYRDANGKSENWKMHNFYHKILAADITILNKIIAEARNAESDVINHLMGSISAEDFKFDQINARVIPKSGYVFQGEEYTADVLVAAYDSKETPEVLILPGVDKITPQNVGRATRVSAEEGVGKVKFSASDLGTKKYAGVIRVKTPAGGVNEYHFNDDYIVARPSLTVSAKKMNVFYIGVDNPVSVSVSGVADANIHPTISKGTIRRGAGGKDWVVKIPKGSTGKAVIKVSAEIDGVTRSMGSSEFRVKRVPAPTATIGGKSSGKINKSVLVATQALIPKMPEDFDFQLDFTITSFKFVTTRSGDVIIKEGKGNMLSSEIRNVISGLGRGAKVWFEDIKAEGPDGRRDLGTISITVQ